MMSMVKTPRWFLRSLLGVIAVLAGWNPVWALGLETFTDFIPSEFDPVGKALNPIEEAFPGLKITGFVRNHTSWVVHKYPNDGNNLDGYMPSASGGLPIFYPRAHYPHRIQNSIWLGQLELDYEFRNNLSLTWINQFIYEWAFQLDPGFRTAHRDAKDVAGFQYYRQFKDYFREFYCDVREGDWKFRIGKQQVVWGKLDGGRVMDFINPEDLREGLEWAGDDWEYSRIPLWMLNVQYYFKWFGDSNDIQMLWIPDFEYNRTWVHPMQGGQYHWPYPVGPLAPWSFNQPDFRVGGVGVLLPPGVPQFPVAGPPFNTSPGEVIIPFFLHRNTPRDFNFNDSAFAFRFAFLYRGWDVHLTYAYIWNYNPRVQAVSVFPIINDPAEPIPSPFNPLVIIHQYQYYRVHKWGANFEKAFILPYFGEKQLVMRGEVVYTKDLYIQDNRQYPLPLWVKKDRVHMAFPVLEMSMFTDWFVSLRTEHDWLIDKKPYLLDGPWERKLDGYETDVGFSLLKFFYHDRAQFLTWFVWRADHGDTWWRAILKFDFTDHVQAHWAFSEYSGNTNDIFGQWGNHDNVELGLRYSF